MFGIYRWVYSYRITAIHFEFFGRYRFLKSCPGVPKKFFWGQGVVTRFSHQHNNIPKVLIPRFILFLK